MELELNLELEEWRAIEGYPEYMVSNYGRIKHLGNNKNRKEKILHPGVSGPGYLHFGLCKDGERKDVLVHRVVAQAFIPNPDNLPEVNHLNQDKQCNIASNLQWVSHESNCNYGDRNEKIQQARRKDYKAVKCLETDIIYESVSAAARSVNRTQASMSMCLHGKTETCGGYHWVFIDNMA